MRDGQSFQEVDGKLLGHIGQDTFLLVKSFLVSTDKAALIVHCQALEQLLFLRGQRRQYRLIT